MRGNESVAGHLTKERWGAWQPYEVIHGAGNKVFHITTFQRLEGMITYNFKEYTFLYIAPGKNKL